MPFDQHKNLAIAVVAVAPSPPDTGLTLTVAAGHGVRYPVPPFDVTIWLATKYPNPDDAEVARCTALAGDVLTLVRAQGGTTARLVQPGDLIAESITAQYLQSLETAIGTTPSPPTLHATTHEVGGSDQITGALSLTTLTASESILAGASVFADLDVVLNGLGVIGWQGRAWFNAPAAGGVITLLNGAFDNFSRLQFGGTTAAFPALRRNSTGLDVVTADASAFGSLIALDLTAANGQVKLAFGGVTIKQGAGSPEGVVPLAVGSLFLRDNGGTGTTLYVKETGAATSTGWTAMVSGGGAPATHRLTHETGGADALQNLSAAILTSGSLPFARVPISAASRLLGRGSAGGAGAMQELTLGTGLTMTGTVLSSSGGGAPAAHASTHASGGSDPVTVTTLAGYPGGTANFLRADGTFAAPPGGAGADEVSVGATDPGATYELWYDTAAVSPTTNYALLNTANTFTQSQTINGNVNVSGDVVMTGAAAGLIHMNTVDGADNKVAQLAGGGIGNFDRGGFINLFGNEYASGNSNGNVDVCAGDGAGGLTGAIRFMAGGLERGRIWPSGGFSWSNTPVDPGAGNLSVNGTVAVTPQTENFLTATRPSGSNRCIISNGTTGLYVGVDSGSLGQGANAAYVYVDSAAGLQLTAAHAGGGIRFASGNLVRGTIHASGGFSWGSGYDPGAGFFSVNPSGSAVGAAHFTVSPGLMQISNTGSGTNTVAGFYNAAGAAGYIQTVGATTVYGTTSDERLKTDRGVLVSTDVLPRLTIHDFVWQDGTPGRGVFAQEAQRVAPFAVSIGTDERDDEGRLAQPWGVDYSKFVPDLIVGWQQHEVTIAALRAEVAALQAARYGTASPSQTLGGWPMALVGWVRDLFRARQKERQCLT